MQKCCIDVAKEEAIFSDVKWDVNLGGTGALMRLGKACAVY